MVEIERPPEIEKLPKEFINRGGYFECEELLTGDASLTAGHPDCKNSDVAIEVVMNGPSVPAAVDWLVRRAYEFLNSHPHADNEIVDNCATKDTPSQ
jgi:hypothetical protein